jgi:hypothetical protein
MIYHDHWIVKQILRAMFAYFGPNNPMMHRAVAEKGISQPAVLQIKLDVVSRPGVRFFDCNAMRADARQSINSSIVRFDVVRAKNQEDVEPSLQRFYQAEVLVPSPIPPDLIVFPKKPVAQFVKKSLVRQAEVKVSSAPVQSVFSDRRKVHAPGCDVSVGGLGENVESAAKARSISEQVKQKLPGEACVSTSGCLPPEWENGSRSESTVSCLPPELEKSGNLFADKCLSHVQECKLLRSCESLPLMCYLIQSAWVRVLNLLCGVEKPSVVMSNVVVRSKCLFKR